MQKRQGAGLFLVEKLPKNILIRFKIAAVYLFFDELP